MAPVLLVHPRTGLNAIGIVNGRPVWPILGGDESDDAAAQAAAKAASDAAAAEAAAAAANDKGFPENTAVADMDAAQQAAYWKFQSRKHESRNAALGNLTTEQLTELRTKAQRADELELTLGTDTERAVASAKQQALAEAQAQYQPMLVKAHFLAAAAGRVDADKLATILEPLDLSKFLAADGTPDTAKVAAYVDGIAPAKGTEPITPKGPTSLGSGRRGGTPTAGVSAAAGRDLWAQMHPEKASK